MLRAYYEEGEGLGDADSSVEGYDFEEPEGDFDTCGYGGDGSRTLPKWMGESSLPDSAESARIDSLDDSFSPRRSKYRRYGTGLGEGLTGSSDRPNAGVCRRFGPYSVACLAIMALILGLSMGITGKGAEELAEEAEEWIEEEWEIEFGHGKDDGHGEQQPDVEGQVAAGGDGEGGAQWDETEQEMFGENGDEGAKDASYDGNNYGWNENEHGAVSPASPGGDWDNGPVLVEYPDAPTLPFRGVNFEDGDSLPDSYAGKDGMSPPLEWGDIPSGTKSFVVLLDEPLVMANAQDGYESPADNGSAAENGTVPSAPPQSGSDNGPGPNVLSHWVAYDIPPGAVGVPGGLPNAERIPADSFGGGDGWSDMFMFQGPNSWGSASDFYTEAGSEGPKGPDEGQTSEATMEAQEQYEGVGVGYHAPTLSSGDRAPRIGYFRLFALAGTLSGGQEGLKPQDATRKEVLRRAEGVSVLGTATFQVLL